jgi:hypothetical protein
LYYFYFVEETHKMEIVSEAIAPKNSQGCNNQNWLVMKNK